MKESTKNTKFTKILFRGLLIGLMLAVWSSTAVTSVAAPAEQQNLLTNPGFEGVYAKQCCHIEPSFPPNTPYDEIQVAPGWAAWWLEPGDPDHPVYCNCPAAWHRPEWREAAPFANRIHSGQNAQKYFTFYSVHEAGMYQQVTGVIAGQRYRFSVYMHAWSTDGPALTSTIKDNDLGMKVGIDPFGGTDAFSANIVWSAPYNAFDNWVLFAVEAIAKSSTITVYTHSMPRWGLEHNDIYVDDASLIAVTSDTPPMPTYPPPITPSAESQSAATSSTSGLPTAIAPRATPVVPSPTDSANLGPTLTPLNTPSPTWPPTSTPLTSGEVWYTVRSRDTLFVIAYYHNTTVAEIKRLNGLSSNTIYPGQKLLIGYVTPQPTATPTLAATLTPSNTPPLVVLPSDTPAPIVLLPDYGQLCVVAYNDANANAQNDNEPMLADVRITLSVGTMPVDGYLTTGSEQSHCFPQLPPGTYAVSVAAPAGYTATTTSESTAQIQPGQIITLVFGIAPARTAPADAGSLLLRGGELLLLAGVAAVVLAAAGIAVMAWVRRK